LTGGEELVGQLETAIEVQQEPDRPYRTGGVQEQRDLRGGGVLARADRAGGERRLMLGVADERDR
jgi:hypothetical protein